MTDTTTDPRAALELIAELARHLAAELDLHNDGFPQAAFAAELEVLLQAQTFLSAAKMPVPEVVTHVLEGGAEGFGKA